MSKRSRSRLRRVQSGTPPSEVTCTALLVVDQAPFLRKALSNCKRLRKELHKKQALLADYEEVDRSAFQQWINSTHGVTLTEIREYRNEVTAFQFILHHLSRCAHYAFEEVPELYQELMRRKKEGTLFNYVSPQQTAQAEQAEDEPEAEFDEEDDSFRKFFDRMFGGADSEGARQSDDARSRREGKSAEDARLKTCYRSLAKRLHPDHSTLDEAVREKRWHEIQDAYHQGDLEGLLRVEAICDMDEQGLSPKLGLARLRELAAYHKSHLIPIRNALRAAKQDIAFGFSQKGATPKIEREIAGNLKFELIELKGVMAQYQRAAKEIRNEVAAELRRDAIRTARSAHQPPHPRQPKGRTATKKQKSTPTGPEQMSFF